MTQMNTIGRYTVPADCVVRMGVPDYLDPLRELLLPDEREVLLPDEREALLPDEREALLREVELLLREVEVLLPEVEVPLFTVEVLRLRLLPEVELPLFTVELLRLLPEELLLVAVEVLRLREEVVLRAAVPALELLRVVERVAELPVSALRVAVPVADEVLRLRLSVAERLSATFPVASGRLEPVRLADVMAVRRLASESTFTTRLLASRDETVTYPAARSLRLCS